MHERELMLKAQIEAQHESSEMKKAQMSSDTSLVLGAQQAQQKHLDSMNKIVQNHDNLQSQEHQAFLNALTATSGMTHGRG